MGVKSIDLAPLRHVEVLPDYFLDGCKGLQEVDLSPLVGLREAGSFCLAWCTGIKSIDLTPLRAVEVLPEGFLNGCNGLEDVDLSPLVRLTEVCEECLQNCASVKTIRLPSHQPANVLRWDVRGLVVTEEE